MRKFQAFVPITKVDMENRLVYGTFTAEVPDRSNEILDYASSKPLFEKWSGEINKNTDGLSKGNLRAMHGKVVAGKVTAIEFDDNNQVISGCAKVVDAAEWEKVIEGCYTGFSIGGSYAKRWTDPNNPVLKRFTAAPAEISLVDMPCVPIATFDLVKAEGVEHVHFSKAVHLPEGSEPPPAITIIEDESEPVGDVVQGWQARDGSFHISKKAALAHNTALAKAAEDRAAEEEAARAASPALAALEKLNQAIATKDGKPAEPSVSPLTSLTQPEIKKAWYLSGIAPEALTAGRVESVWALLHNPRVSKAQTDAKAREVSLQTVEEAWKKFIKSAPPAAGTPELQLLTMRKGLYTVGRVASLLGELSWLQDDLEFEAALEGDTLETAQGLKASISALCAFLRQLVVSETEELMEGNEVDVIEMMSRATMGKAVKLHRALHKAQEVAPDLGISPRLLSGLEKIITHKGADSALAKSAMSHLQKAHDSINKATNGMTCSGGAEKVSPDLDRSMLEHVTDAHDSLIDAGCDCGSGSVEKGVHTHEHAASEEEAAALAKAAGLNQGLVTENTLLKAQLSGIETLANTLAKRVEALEAQPLPPKGIKRVVPVEKTADGLTNPTENVAGGGNSEETLLKLIGGMSEKEVQRALMKHALRNPVLRIGD